MLGIDQFEYNLPSKYIAQWPMEPRDHSRLLVLDRQSSQVQHRFFYDLPTILTQVEKKTHHNTQQYSSDIVIIRNNTKVIPVRLLGQKTTGGRVEILLTKRLAADTQNNQPGELWEAMTHPGLKPGQTVKFADSDLMITCSQSLGRTRIVRTSRLGLDLLAELNRIGLTPTPPYIKNQKHSEQEIRQKYQTTFAKISGSAAAPTAGLHFTPDLDTALAAAGIEIIELTLHVGLGTFLRVKETDVTKHHMHSEWFSIHQATADRINQVRKDHKKIIAVGTTTTRVLESVFKNSDTCLAQTGQTDIYLYPPCSFKAVDGLITNFHEPHSTLLMLVSAFTTQPNTTTPFTDFDSTPVGKAYQAALENNYRFLSFGDGMLIW